MRAWEGVQCHLVAVGFFRKRKLSAVSHNPVTPVIVNIDRRIRAVSSLARLAELILSDFLFLHDVWIQAPVCVCLSLSFFQLFL